MGPVKKIVLHYLQLKTGLQIKNLQGYVGGLHNM